MEKKEKAEHKNYIDMEVYLSDIKRYRETAETQKMLLDKIVKENEGLKEENKKLNIIIENTEKEQEADREHIERLEEENKKLKEELNEWVNGAINSLRETPELLNRNK